MGCCECDDESPGSIKCRDFLTSWVTISFRRLIFLHGAGCLFDYLASCGFSVTVAPLPPGTNQFAVNNNNNNDNNNK